MCKQYLDYYFEETQFRSIMKTVALIPIKLSSTRVPGKNIKPFFDGTPLMHFIQKACLNAKIYLYIVTSSMSLL